MSKFAFRSSDDDLRDTISRAKDRGVELHVEPNGGEGTVPTPHWMLHRVDSTRGGTNNLRDSLKELHDAADKHGKTIYTVPSDAPKYGTKLARAARMAGYKKHDDPQLEGFRVHVRKPKNV